MTTAENYTITESACGINQTANNILPQLYKLVMVYEPLTIVGASQMQQFQFFPQVIDHERGRHASHCKYR